jgi:hypothetical protein
VDDRFQAAAALGEAVFDPGWDLGVHHALDQPPLPAAVAAARRADVDGRVTWRVADVTDVSTVDLRGEPAATVQSILDNGCLHGLRAAQRPGWAHTVRTLAAPGATLLIRAALRRRGPGPRGINADELHELTRDDWDAEPSPEPGWYRLAFRA